MSGDAWAPQRAAVRAALEGLGLTQADLAHQLGITQKHMSQLLTGRADGNVQLWARIAAALGCTWTLSWQEDR